MPANEALLMGFVVLMGIGWQCHLLFEKDNWSSGGDPPPRMIIPFGIGLIVFLGCTAAAFMRLLDDRLPEFGLLQFLGASFGALGFLIFLSAKSVFGPFYLMTVAVCALYQYFNGGDGPSPLELTTAILKLVLEPAPQWLKYVFGLATCIYSLVGAVHDSEFDFTHA